MRNLPPYPTGDLHNWAQQLVSYLQNRGEVDAEVLPQAVLLAHQIDDDRAGTNGILMFDPVSSAVVVSEGGVWVPIIAGYGDLPVLADYGDGTATQANIDAMEADVGYIRINRPQTVTTDLLISTPLSVMAGGYFTVEAGNTLTLDDEVNSTRQFIFQGDGDILLNSPKCRDAVQPQWFGAFPNTGFNTAVQWTKMFASVPPDTELEVDSGAGTFTVGSQIVVTRAGRISGLGQRRTHFRVATALDGTDAIITGEQGCIFEDLQFSAVAVRTGGAFIKFNHPFCEARRVWSTDGFIHIDVGAGANACVVQDITGFTNSSAAGSCIVALRDTVTLARVEDIYFYDTVTSEQPESIVRVEGASDYRINNVRGHSSSYCVGLYVDAVGSSVGRVKDVLALSGTAVGAEVVGTSVNRLSVRGVDGAGGPKSCVYLLANGGDINNLNIGDLKGDTSTDTASLVNMETLNDGAINGVTVSGYTASTNTPSIMRINNGDGACRVERVSVDNGAGGNETTGTFFDITSLGGTVKDCAVGAGVIPDDMLEFFRTSGTGIDTDTLRTPFQDYVRAGYGGIRLAVPVALADLTPTAWRTLPADSASLAESKGVTQRFDANCLNLNVVGVWQLSASFSISHDEAQSGRTFKVRLYNTTGAIASPSTVVGIGRNTDATTFSFSALFEVTSENVGNRIRVDIGEASVTVGSVFVNSFSYSAIFVSEYSR